VRLPTTNLGLLFRKKLTYLSIRLLQLTTLGKKKFTDVFQARDAVRNGVGRGTRITVHVVGDHFLSTPLELDSRDSGTKQHPIHWKGEPNSKMSGGIAIPYTGFSKATVPSGAEGVVKASLFPLGFNTSSLGGIANPYPHTLAQLYVDGKPQLLARSPNKAQDGTWMWYGYESISGGGANWFSFNDTDAVKIMDTALKTTNGLWIHCYSQFDWRDSFVKIDSITTMSSGAMNVSNGMNGSPQYPWVAHSRFYAVDSLMFLDTPGEYFIDREQGIIYYYPFTPLSASSQIVVSHLKSVVENGAKHITFSGMTVSDSTGVAFSNVADNVTVVNLTISNAGSTCLETHGDDVNIENNIVFGCSNDGISVNSGNLQTLERGNTRVVGNTVTNFSLIVRTYQPAIGFSGVGMYIANNTLSHGPHTAITGGGNDNLFEFNSISKMCFECTDTGAFYVGRSWSQRGNVARYNSFDTIRPTERLAQESCSQNAFYLDDQMSGWEFYGNIITNSTTGVLLGGGRGNKIYNNTFINNDKDIAFDGRGLTWQRNYCNHNCTDPKKGPESSCFLHELQSLDYTHPPYSTAYPELLSIYNEEPCTPVHNQIYNNKYCHTKSKKGGEFIDVSDKQIAAWGSTISNNVAICASN